MITSPEISTATHLRQATSAMTARQNDPETVREEGINVLLAQSLRDHGVSARAERRSRKGAPDVRAELRSGDLVILECKWDGFANLLDSQLEERLKDFSEALGMVGVLYPDGLRYEENAYAGLEAATDLQWWLHGWWLHGSRGVATPEPRIRSGSGAELADQLRTPSIGTERCGRLFSEPMQVETVRSNGPDTWMARLVGTRVGV